MTQKGRSPPPKDNAALRWIETHLDRRPKDGGLWYSKGVVLAKMGHLEQALKAFERALWLDPDHLKALEAYGKALFRMELFLEAFDIFRRLTRRVPRDEGYWYYCGESLLQVGREAKAVPYYDQALEINPNFTDAVLGRAKALQPEEGRAESTTPVPAEPSSPVDTLLQAGESAFYVEDYEEALRNYDEALAREEDNAGAWEAKGRVLARLARYSEAAECYERAGKANPQDPTILLQHGKALRSEGRLEAALNSLLQAVDADVENLEAQVELREVSEELEVRDVRESEEPPKSRGRRRKGRRPPKEPTFATHIEVLDLALEGGVIPGSVILVTGPPGSYKTTLCFWILYQQCLAEGTKGLLITLEQSKSNLLQHLVSLGIDPTPVAGKLRILDLTGYRTRFRPTGSPHEWLDILSQKIREVQKQGVQAVALDSLEALEALVGFPNRRRELHRVFDFLRSLDLTAFLTAERYEMKYQGQTYKVVDLPEHLSDGILELSWRWREGDADGRRALRITKMRDRKHATDLYYLTWDRGLTLARALTAPPP